MQLREDRHARAARKSARDAAGRAPEDTPAGRVLGLQHSAGNRAVSSLLVPAAGVQRRVETIGRAADPEAVELALCRLDAALDLEALDETPAPSPVQASRVQRQGPGEPPRPREGKPADVVKAVLKTPEGQQAIQILKEKAETEIRSLQPGERAAVVSAAIVIAAPAVTAAMMRPDSRSFMLDQVSGKKVSIPGLTGVSAQVDFKDGRPTGGMVHVDVGRFLPPQLGFGPAR
jgi:hypothetical protein